MSQTVGQLLASSLVEVGVSQVFGIVGDALNAFTDGVRTDGRLEWIGVRHEEGAALAAAGQAKLTGRLGVCAGTTGPGANHLLAGLYEAAHDHAPVLAISGAGRRVAALFSPCAVFSPNTSCGMFSRATPRLS